MSVLLGPWPLAVAVVVFIAAAFGAAAGAVRMAGLGDILADRTGWGEALFGAVFFGAATSLSGMVVTTATALSDSPHLAYSNAVGGIAAQTLAIAIADLFYRRVNIEHAAASLANILFGCLLVTAIILVVLAAYTPDLTVLSVHPMSLLIVVVYIGGLHLVRRSSGDPMWTAVRTRATRPDDPSEEGADARGSTALWTEFIVIGAAVALGGWALAIAAESIVGATGLTQGLVGGVLLGLVNGIPETITAIAAARRGAVTLAIAAVIGGNAFDVVHVVVGDVAYRGGSIYHAVGSDELFLSLASGLMGVVVVAGMLVRQRRGPARIGWEGITLVVTYAAIVAVLAL